jgi:serine O-acetyltransferase
MKCYLREIEAVQENDPAAKSPLEIVLTYPGVHALWFHRAAHALYRRDRHVAARVVSHVNRFVTGIEIHPGATIGQGVFIDHGMGVVIGETATVGDNCILYKGVVLGGTTHERGVRHPQVGKNVVLGTNATVLGNIAIGDGARIGSGSVVIRPVPEKATVVGVPGRIVRAADQRTRFDDTLDHANLPDPVVEMIRSLRHENERLRNRLARVESAVGIGADDEEDDHLIDATLATADLPPQHGG